MRIQLPTHAVTGPLSREYTCCYFVIGAITTYFTEIFPIYLSATFLALFCVFFRYENENRYTQLHHEGRILHRYRFPPPPSGVIVSVLAFYVPRGDLRAADTPQLGGHDTMT